MACKESSLEGLFDHIDQAKLDQICKEKHLVKMSESISRWEELTSYLDLVDVEVEDIKEVISSPRLRRKEMLIRWQQKKGKKATYRALAKSFAHGGRRDLAELVCEMVQEENNVSTSSDDEQYGEAVCKPPRSGTTSYGDHLRRLYQAELCRLPATEFLPSPTNVVFNLALISHRPIQYGKTVERMMQLILKGEVEEILAEKKEVQLKDIFKSGQPIGGRKLILIEGAPGAGKSTLACLICQKWGAGELFQEFKLVIFVRLNDPHIQSAQLLADIFHSGSYFDPNRIVSTLQSEQGRGVLFVVDGWDEYAPQLKEDSLFVKLIHSPGDLSMQCSAVIVTSRPVASGRLQRDCSSRIEIIGFRQEELKRYFQMALENNADDIAKLEQCLKEKPIIKKSCYLPLNAAIIAHTFLSTDGTLPSTIHDVFRKLVHIIVNRHMEKLGQMSESVLEDNCLPSPFQEHFEKLCKLAYDGVTKNKTTFSAEDLESQGITSSDQMLSLLKGVASFASSKQSIFYAFLHLSIQELLATHFILQLPLDGQFKAFQPLFGQPRFVAIFQFYASQTKVDQHASEFCSFFAEVFKQIQSHVDSESKRHPMNWQGDIQRINDNPETFHAEFSSTEPVSFPKALSSLDAAHIVLYCPLPFFDMGYVLMSVSVSRVKELKFDFCACIRDDVKMYGHLSGVRFPSTSRVTGNTNTVSETPFPYIYVPYDFVGDIVSSPDYDNIVKGLPQWCSSVKDRFIVMTCYSPVFFPWVRDVQFSDSDEFDCSNTLIVVNITGEAEMKSVNQELENIKEHCNCQIQ